MPFSFYISFGKKGFKLFEKDGPSIRTRLWVVSFCFTLTDVEKIIRGLLKRLEEHDIKEDHVQKEIAKLNSERDILEGCKETLNRQREELDKQKQELENAERLKAEIERLEEQVSNLSDELEEYEDTDNENEELKEEINVLNNKISHLQFEIHYLESYFNLR